MNLLLSDGIWPVNHHQRDLPTGSRAGGRGASARSGSEDEVPERLMANRRCSTSRRWEGRHGQNNRLRRNPAAVAEESLSLGTLGRGESVMKGSAMKGSRAASFVQFFWCKEASLPVFFGYVVVVWALFLLRTTNPFSGEGIFPGGGGMKKKPDEGGRLRRKKPDEAETTKSSLRSRESISISTIPYLKCIIATRWWQLIHLSSYFHILTGTQATTSNNLIEYQGKMGLNSSICISVPFSLFSNMVP